MRLFTSGIASYFWFTRNGHAMIMVPVSGGQILLYHQHYPLCVLYDGSQGAAVDPQVSPDGSQVAFVIERDLYVIDTVGVYTLVAPTALVRPGLT